MLRNFLRLAVLILVLPGCQINPPPPPADKPPPPADRAPAESAQPEEDPAQREIERLLYLGSVALADNRLTTPLNDNAYFLYLRVLTIDPDNVDALQGLGDIAEKYLEWAIDSANDNRFHSATDFLNKARSVDEDHPNIAAVRNLIEERRSSSRLIYYLAADGLEQRTAWIVDELRGIGRTAAEHHATAEITARTDEEGRWIYQQLNQATPDRLRARFELGARPSIRLRY